MGRSQAFVKRWMDKDWTELPDSWVLFFWTELMVNTTSSRAPVQFVLCQKLSTTRISVFSRLKSQTDETISRLVLSFNTFYPLLQFLICFNEIFWCLFFLFGSRYEGILLFFKLCWYQINEAASLRPVCSLVKKVVGNQKQEMTPENTKTRCWHSTAGREAKTTVSEDKLLIPDIR